MMCLKIALVALLGSIAVEGYGPRINYSRRGSSHGRELFQLDHLGRNGPRGPYGPYGKHRHPPFYKRMTSSVEGLRRQWSHSEESSESDSRYSSELEDDSFDSSEYSRRYRPGRRPCWGWRCHPQDINAPWARPIPSSKTTPEVPSKAGTEKWNSMAILESFMKDHRTQEPVTTPKTIPALTVSPNVENIMSRMAPIEEVSFSVTTATPETNPTTMSSPETTTVSQAVLDCIENCISTPEFYPVCGSNDQTYGNIGKLYCAKSCGINVELRRMSRCRPRLPFYDDYDSYDDFGESDGVGRGNDLRDGNEGSGDDGSDRGGSRGADVGSDGGDEPSLQPDGEPLQPPWVTARPSLLPDVEQSPPPGEGTSNPPSSNPSSSLDGEHLPPTRDGNAVITPDSFLSSLTTNLPRIRRTTHLTDLQNCMKLCPVTITYYPICGTDLVTYINIDRLECAKACGQEVQILCEQPCHVCNLGRRTLSSTTMLSTTTLSITASPTTTSPRLITPETVQTISRNVDSATPAMLMEQCIKSCPVTAEYNPICGTNNVNYTNPIHLLCVQMCGDDVKVARFGPCLPDTRIETPIATTEKEEEEVTLAPEIIQCMGLCVVTSEYNPVCGTNEETYTNLGRLECAKYCGIDVAVSYKGFCNGFFFSEITSSKPLNDRTSRRLARVPQETSTSTLVQTTLSTTPIITQSPKSLAPSFLPLIYSTDASSTSSNTPTTASTPTTTTTESPQSTHFTLAPDVLKNLFGDSLTLKSTTDMTTKDDEFSVDARFGNADENDAHPKGNLDPNRIVFPE